MRILLLLFPVVVCSGCAPIVLSAVIADRADQRLAILVREAAIDPDRAGILGLVMGDNGLVASVAYCSPAEQADVRAGDRVVSIDGRPVEGTPTQLAGRPGTEVVIVIVRDDQARSISLRRMEWLSVFDGVSCPPAQEPGWRPGL